MKSWIVWTVVLFPVLGIGCELDDVRRCREQFVELVSLRDQAIEGAFGDLSEAMPEQVRITYITSKDPRHTQLAGGIGYDAENRTLLFSRAVAFSKTPRPLRAAAYYWPF